MRMHVLHKHKKTIDKSLFETAIANTDVLPQGLPARPTEPCRRPVAGLKLYEVEMCGECQWMGTTGMRKHYLYQHPTVDKPDTLAKCHGQRFNSANPYFKVETQEADVLDERESLLEEFARRQTFQVDNSAIPTDVRNMSSWARFTGWLEKVRDKDVELLLCTVDEASE